MWIKFYTFTPITVRTEQIFPRPRCSNILEEFGDRLLTCRCSSVVGSANLTTRHNRQVKLLADDLTHASRTPTIEPKQHINEYVRLGIRAIGRRGGDDIIARAIVHIFPSPSARTRTLTGYSSLLRSKYQSKVTKHTPLLSQQTGGSIVPIIFAASGG